jgi:8-oxo-dGTP diphosphatase
MRLIPGPEQPIDLATLTPVRTEPARDNGTPRHVRRSARVIVGAAIVTEGRVLACARAHPPETAGRWEFPGGKVEPGETEADALVRECAEELAVRVEVGDRVGDDVPMAHGRAVLKVYAAKLLHGDQPQPLEHAELRWLSVDELGSVPWLPADEPVVAALAPLLATPPDRTPPGPTAAGVAGTPERGGAA